MQTGPWWFSGMLTFIGVIIGILAKWGIDEMARKRNQDREDRLRFLADKRQCYIDFLASCGSFADAREEYRDIKLLRKELEASKETSDEEWGEYNARVQRADDAWDAATVRTNEALAAVDLLAPVLVSEAANRFASMAFRPHLLPRRVAAELAFIKAARDDLGAPGGGRQSRTWPYEPFEDDPADLAEMNKLKESVVEKIAMGPKDLVDD